MLKRSIFLVLGLSVLAASFPALAEERGLLVVSPEEEWIAAVEPLLELRRVQGWQVSVEVVSRPDAYALRTLIGRARDAQPHLTHVLLLGSDGSLPMARRRNAAVQVLDTDIHALGDDLYGLPGPDGVPALAIGRFPFDWPSYHGHLAKKTVRYERERAALSSTLLLIAGRTPASRRKALGLISPQRLADHAARTLLAGLLKRLARVKVRSRTAFDGPGEFSHEDAPAVFAEELKRRPFLWAYAGHGGAGGFATFHQLDAPNSVRGVDIFDMDLKEVTGPLVSSGCHMASPVFNTVTIAVGLLLSPGGPPAMAAFTGVNEDYWVAQWFEELLARLDGLDGPTTLGELVLRSKRAMVTAPPSDLNLLVESFMRSSGQLRYHIDADDYPDIVRRNNEMLIVLGDPCLTVEIPKE